MSANNSGGRLTAGESVFRLRMRRVRCMTSLKMLSDTRRISLSIRPLSSSWPRFGSLRKVLLMLGSVFRRPVPVMGVSRCMKFVFVGLDETGEFLSACLDSGARPRVRESEGGGKDLHSGPIVNI